ncbi:hypothetical protein [Bradyrhizobium sp. CCGE-LA001]|uniref:hypothetical protein n=1 Tax=Bradyrhizobium sp. CCGE-LA001 TaxID=1223566 RepID=UPI0011982A63|nr:hypothetical protein [Bradyrhizobium sp. CCGE-LA001]
MLEAVRSRQASVGLRDYLDTAGEGKIAVLEGCEHLFVSLLLCGQPCGPATVSQLAVFSRGSHDNQAIIGADVPAPRDFELTCISEFSQAARKAGTAKNTPRYPNP